MSKNKNEFIERLVLHATSEEVDKIKALIPHEDDIFFDVTHDGCLTKISPSFTEDFGWCNVVVVQKLTELPDGFFCLGYRYELLNEENVVVEVKDSAQPFSFSSRGNEVSFNLFCEGGMYLHGEKMYVVNKHGSWTSTETAMLEVEEAMNAMEIMAFHPAMTEHERSLFLGAMDVIKSTLGRHKGEK